MAALTPQQIKDAITRATAATVGPWEGVLSAQDSEFIATILGEALQAYRDLLAAREALQERDMVLESIVGNIDACTATSTLVENIMLSARATLEGGGARVILRGESE